MAEMTRVALDAMGGDNAPVEMVKGAVDAVNKEQNVTVLLVGIEEIVREELGKYSYDKERIQVVGATEVIETAEPPVKDRKSTRLNSSHVSESRMPSSA